jgi:hypothetical protein
MWLVGGEQGYKGIFFSLFGRSPLHPNGKNITIFSVMCARGRALRGSTIVSVLSHSSLRRSPTIPNAVVLHFYVLLAL